MVRRTGHDFLISTTTTTTTEAADSLRYPGKTKRDALVRSAEQLDAKIEADPNLAAAHTALGIVLLGQRDWQGMVDVLTPTIEQDAEYEAAYDLLELAYKQRSWELVFLQVEPWLLREILTLVSPKFLSCAAICSSIRLNAY